MGKVIRAREEELARREQAVMAQLAAHSRKVRGPEPRVRPHEALMTPLIREWWPYWVRQPDDWECRTRSRDERRQRADLVRHLFQVYPVPRFLERLWEPDERGRADPEAREYLSWYVAVATGQSLYKECARHLLSRRECHLFLNAPEDQGVAQNLWWARAIAAGAPLGTACTIARSKLTRHPPADEFWIAAMRFFVRFPVRLAEMDDLLDYLAAAHRENPNFSMKGRALEAVRAGSEAWHRLQVRMKAHGTASWSGSPLPDWEHETGRVEKGDLTTWRIGQITNGRDLVHEGTAQHHCVGTYKDRCIRGLSSIWSMTQERMGTGERKRALTLELDQHERLVQARGYANRLARPEEKAVLELWMRANGIGRATNYW